MLIEQSTNYAYKLKYIEHLSFDKVRDLAVRFMRELPQQLQDELYEALNRGVDILDSEPQMVTYLYAFGPMHQAKLNYAFKHLPEEFLEQPEINIIDYGCGQALGTMCYADYLREYGYAQKVKTITLIEPSEMCLKRAALHASMFFPDAEIKTVNKTFNELDENDIYCEEDTLHILSNVLDILDFDLEGFADVINSQVKGYNQFVCVGPFFDYSDKDERMEKFRSLLEGKESYCAAFDKYELDLEKTWTAQILCFSIGKEEEKKLPTGVTEEEILNGVEDELGVIYSKDGKRLLKCKNGNLNHYSVKEGTNTICDRAFFEIESLEQISIPESVKYIGDKAFYNNAIKDIIIPDSVVSIGNSAFCFNRFEEICISNSLKYIGSNPFVSCGKQITPDTYKLTITSHSNRFFVENKMLIDKSKNKLVSYYGDDENLTIPNHITSIGDSAFFGVDSLEQIVIPAKVTNIESGAFCSCENIIKIDIKCRISIIEDETFEFCHSLQQVEIPDSVTQIKNFAFAFCSSLKQVILPDSIVFIGWKVFAGCYSLESIIIPRGSKKKFKEMLDEELWDKLVESSIDRKIHHAETTENELEETVEDEYGVVYSRDGNRLLKCKNKNIESYNIKQGTRIICDSAFLENEALKQIVIPDSVTNIEDLAFCGCKTLQKIDIPNSVTSIGYNAFGLCESLQRINIPDSVTFLGPTVFHKCISLQQVTISKSLARIDYQTFYECTSLQQIVIPNSITVISDWSFSKCSSLKQIIIPNSVTYIGEGAFSRCVSLQQVTLSDSLCSVGPFAFEKCQSIKRIACPKLVTHIYAGAFSECVSLQQISISNSAAEIGDEIFHENVFKNCRSIQQIIIPKGSIEKFKEKLDEELWDKLIEK